MRFEFATAGRILFGNGTLSGIAPLVKELGSSALIITGRRSERAAPLLELLRSARISCETFSLAGEPTVQSVADGAEAARTGGFQVVVGFGGGSAIDAAKAVAAFATNPGDPYDHLEVVGRGLPLAQPPLPIVAVPTTAGTGAEVTRNAVLASAEHQAKVSLRSPMLLPRLAVVDPELTLDLPPDVTASTGMDALTQLIEPFVSIRANPVTDAICRAGIPRVARSLLRAFENGSDGAAREDMALGSLFGGLALANSGLGIVHGFAAPIGGMFPAPHGAVCATLLPYALGVNTQALVERSPDSEALQRFGEVARMLTGDKDSSIAEGIRWIRKLSNRLAIAPLSRYGVTTTHIPELVEKASRASSTKGNPIALTEKELSLILKHAIKTQH